jgi:hypothetical protein
MPSPPHKPASPSTDRLNLFERWLVTNRRGDVAAVCVTEGQANATRDAYPEAKLKVEGFVAIDQHRGAVEALRVYGQHMAECVYPDNPERCTCGLTQSLTLFGGQ